MQPKQSKLKSIAIVVLVVGGSLLCLTPQLRPTVQMLAEFNRSPLHTTAVATRYLADTLHGWNVSMEEFLQERQRYLRDRYPQQ